MSAPLRWHLNGLVPYPEKRKKMGQAARVAVERNSWQRMAEQYLQLYEKIVEHD